MPVATEEDRAAEILSLPVDRLVPVELPGKEHRLGPFELPRRDKLGLEATRLVEHDLHRRARIDGGDVEDTHR